jgi:uncharacterized protein (DUF924 family)
MDKAEQVLQYMLRPSIENCLDLWFGKSAQTDREIRDRFGVDVALASSGKYDHWALDVAQPRRLVTLLILLDQFPRNVYRGTARMYASDARCQSLVRSARRLGASERLRPVERVFLCLVLTHSEMLEDQYLCMAEWGRAMAGLTPEAPLSAFDEIFRRHVVVIRRFGRFPHRKNVLQRVSSAAEEDFLREQRLPLRPAASPAPELGTRLRTNVRLWRAAGGTSDVDGLRRYTSFSVDLV